MKKVRIGIIAALAMFSLSGCGEEKRVDYAIEGIAETGQSNEETQEEPGEELASGSLAQFEGEEKWKETWRTKSIELKWDGDIVTEVDVEVNAEITVPQVKQMSVVEVTEPAFDAAFKEKVAENIFQSGEIYYGNPSNLPKRELQKMRDDFFSSETNVYYDNQAESAMISEYWKELSVAWNNIEEANETYTNVEEYTVNQYVGTYEGRMYNLSFAETAGDNFSMSRRLKRMKWTVKDLYEVYPEKFKEQKGLDCSPWMMGDWIDNQCELSEEEALQEAKKLVEQLGLDYPVYSYSRPLLWGTAPDVVKEESETDRWGINGYVFYFDLGVDNLSFMSYGTEEDYFDFLTSTEWNEEKQYSLQAQLQVYVTDRGVIRMIADNPMEITGLTEGVELLPLDTIKSIMKESMNEQWETLRLNAYVTGYNGMELIHFRIRDKENPGSYSYVPAWRLAKVVSDTTLHQISIRNPVLINAIDGSLIDFFDET